MVTLYNVIDIRTWRFYSVAIVKPHNVKWFVAADGSEIGVNPVTPSNDNSAEILAILLGGAV